MITWTEVGGKFINWANVNYAWLPKGDASQVSVVFGEDDVWTFDEPDEVRIILARLHTLTGERTP